MLSFVTAAETAQPLATAPEHHTIKPSSININNESAAKAKITLQDVFSADTTHGVSSPTQNTINKFAVVVGAGLTADIPEDELKDVKFLGTMQAVSDVTSSSVTVMVGYHLV